MVLWKAEERSKSRFSSPLTPLSLLPRPSLPSQVLDLLRLRELYGLERAHLPVGSDQELGEMTTLLRYLFPRDADHLLCYYFGRAFLDSAILTSTPHRDALMGFLPSLRQSPQLLYRATRDGWGCPDFHGKCDDQGPTVVIIQSSNGYIFGGYTSASWSPPADGSDGDSYCDETFLFSVTNPTNHPPVKMPLKPRAVGEPPHPAIHRRKHLGPVFGDKTFGVLLREGQGAVMVTSPGLVFSMPALLAGQSDEALVDFFMGDKRCQLTELEVYSLRKRGGAQT